MRRVALAGRRQAGGREVAVERAGGGHRRRRRGARGRRPRCCRRARAGAGPDRASRRRCPTASRASRRGASSARSRGAVAPSAVRGWRVRAFGVSIRVREVCADISLRYIGASIHTANDGSTSGVRTAPEPGSGPPCRPLYTGAVRRHTDYALARRAVLRDLRTRHGRPPRRVRRPPRAAAGRPPRRGAGAARLPGLLGPARPLRLVRLRRAPPPGQRPLHRAPERARAPRRRARGVRPLRRGGVPRLPLEPPRPARAARPPPRGAPSRRRPDAEGTVARRQQMQRSRARRAGWRSGIDREYGSVCRREPCVPWTVEDNEMADTGQAPARTGRARRRRAQGLAARHS